jgi:hypothetical protein
MDSTEEGSGPERPGRLPANAASGLARSAALVVCVATFSAPVFPGHPEPARPPTPSTGVLEVADATHPPPASSPRPSGSPLAPTSLASDLRVLAFLEAYSPLIDSVVYVEHDAIFYMGRVPIHFRDGRMVAAHRLDRAEACDPIFYAYPLEPLTELPLPPPAKPSTYCADVMESLWGTSEREIRTHGRLVTFLDHRMFVNRLLVEPLASVERELRRAAVHDREVARWIGELSITYSFVSRDIAGTSSPSQHGFGLAVDLVPRSYGGRHVYWRWSRALDREGWWRIPLERRWSPPASVVRTFERHGFVWGGKWSHFDAIHFEYRPDIIAYSRLASGGTSGATSRGAGRARDVPKGT